MIFNFKQYKSVYRKNLFYKLNLFQFFDVEAAKITAVTQNYHSAKPNNFVKNINIPDVHRYFINNQLSFATKNKAKVVTMVKSSKVRARKNIFFDSYLNHYSRFLFNIYRKITNKNLSSLHLKKTSVVFLRLLKSSLVQVSEHRADPASSISEISKQFFRSTISQFSPEKGLMLLSLARVFSKKGSSSVYYSKLISFFFFNKIMFLKSVGILFSHSIRKYNYSFKEQTIGFANLLYKPHTILSRHERSKLLKIFFSLLKLPVIFVFFVNKWGVRRLVSCVTCFTNSGGGNNHAVLPVVSPGVVQRFLKLSSSKLISAFLSDFQTLVELKPWQHSGQTILIPTPITNFNRRHFSFLRLFRQSVSERVEFTQRQKIIKELTDFVFKHGLTINKFHESKQAIKRARPLTKKIKFFLS